MRLLPKRTTLPATLPAVRMVGLVAGICAGMAVAAPGERSPASPSSPRANLVGDQQLAAWVEQRIEQWQVGAADRRFDEIGWAKDLCDAERLAKKHRRPVFLFTHDGRIAIGRC